MLLEALGGPDEFREFQMAHMTSLAMSARPGDEARTWDA
jgi:hypothetical protein